MTLREYLDSQEGMSAQELAKLIKLTPGQTSDLLNRRRGCSLKAAVRIERVTGGAVSCRDLLPMNKKTR